MTAFVSMVALTAWLEGAPPVDPIARAKFPDFLLECGEGSTDWLYLDQGHPPNVTIGRGNLLPNLAAALRLDWRDAQGMPVSSSAVQAAWLRVVSHPELAVHGGGAYKALTSVRATQTSIDALIDTEIDRFEGVLRAQWPGWDVAPGAAQEALMRLAWAVGPAFAPKWPRLHAAWVARNWQECAVECRIPSLDAVEPHANDAEAALFESCVPAPEA